MLNVIANIIGVGGGKSVLQRLVESFKSRVTASGGITLLTTSQLINEIKMLNIDDFSWLYQAGTAKAGTAFVIQPNEASADLDVSRASGAMQVNALGQYEIVGNNVPVVNHDIATGEFLGSYHRQSLINRWTNSEPATVPVSGTTSLIEATPMVNDWNRGLDGMVELDNTGGVTSTFGDTSAVNAAGTFTISALVKLENNDEPIIGTSNSSSNDFNLAIGGVNIDDSELKVKIPIGGGIWFICGSATAVGASANTYLRKRNSQSSNKVYVSAVTVVAGDVTLSPYDYVKTEGGTVTRAADAFTKTDAAAYIGQTELTVYIEGYFSNTIGASQSFITVSDGGSSNRVGIFKNVNQIGFVVFTSGALQVLVSSNQLDISGRFKAAVRVQQNNFALAVNGAVIATDLSGTVPAMSNINIGHFNNGATSFVNENILAVGLQSVGRDNTYLEELTTL